MACTNTAQGMYNAITRNLDAELFVACRRYGIDIVVYNPIAGGLFSGKYTAESLAQTPESGRFSDTAGSGKSSQASELDKPCSPVSRRHVPQAILPQQHIRGDRTH